MRKRIALTVVVAVAAVTAPAQAATKSVSVGDNWFVKERGVPTVTVKAGDTELEARVRIDTPMEAEYFRHGGILQYVLRQLRDQG